MSHIKNLIYQILITFKINKSIKTVLSITIKKL